MGGLNLDELGQDIKSPETETSLEEYRQSLNKMLSSVNDVEICRKRIIGNVSFDDFVESFKSSSEKRSIDEFEYKDKKYCIKVKKDQKWKVGSIDIELSKDITYEECVKLYEKLYNVVIWNLDSFDEEHLNEIFQNKFYCSSYNDFKELLDDLWYSHKEISYEQYRSLEFSNGCEVSIFLDWFWKGNIASISITWKDILKLMKKILSSTKIMSEKE